MGGDLKTCQSGVRMGSFLGGEQAKGIGRNREGEMQWRQLIYQVLDKMACESLPLWDSVILKDDANQFVEQKLKANTLASQPGSSIGNGFLHLWLAVTDQ